MKFYTYAHTKPDGTVFYLGKGQGQRAWTKQKRNKHWKNIVNKYKGYNVEIIAFWDTEEEALSHEILLIDCFKYMGYKLVNLTDGGEGVSGYRFSDESKQKLSESKLGVKNPMFGKFGEKHHNFGLHHSENTKQKLAKASREKTGRLASNFKYSIIATCTITGKETEYFGSFELRKAGFCHSNVYTCIIGKRKTHKNHTFKRNTKWTRKTNY